MKAKDILIGSIWQGNLDKYFIAIVDEVVTRNYQIDVKLTIVDTRTAEVYFHGFNSAYLLKAYTPMLTESDLYAQYVKGQADGYDEGYQHGFTLAKEKINELDEQEKQSIYYEGYDSGHNQWQDDYGFTVPNNTVKNLEATNYKKGLKDAVSINAATRQHHYDMGYNDALAHMASEEAENTLEIKKQGHEEGYAAALSESDKPDYKQGLEEGFDKGYNAAIKGMRSDEALGEECENFSVEDFGAVGDGYPREKYTVTEGVDIIDFIKKNIDNIKSYTQVGDAANIEMFEKYNSGNNEQLKKELELVEKYPHYYKDIRHLNIIDIYRFFDLFEVTDPCIQHSVKKLAVGGKRGAKDYEKDIKEAMDTLKRWEYMQEENKRGLDD